MWESNFENSGRTVEFWFKAYKENNSKLTTSKQGICAVTNDYSPFLDLGHKETEKPCRDNQYVFTELRI